MGDFVAYPKSFVGNLFSFSVRLHGKSWALSRVLFLRGLIAEFADGAMALPVRMMSAWARVEAWASAGITLQPAAWRTDIVFVVADEYDVFGFNLMLLAQFLKKRIYCSLVVKTFEFKFFCSA